MGKYEQEMQKRTEIARYFVENNSTVRETAKKFNRSKSNVHYILREGKYLDHFIDEESLSTKVLRQLNKNKSERHFRGGEATKQKYIKMRNKT